MSRILEDAGSNHPGFRLKSSIFIIDAYRFSKFHGKVSSQSGLWEASRFILLAKSSADKRAGKNSNIRLALIVQFQPKVKS